MLQTTFELTGQWTSSEDGQQFVLDVANETGVEIDSIGKSYLGKDIYRLTMGSGDRLMVITGGVHRSEDASRELVMIKARDMAYNLDEKYSDYLATHKIMIIPTVSPDVNSRNNAQGLNINRDAYYLETTEMAALMSMIADEKPEVYIDFHERGGTLRQVEFINPSNLDANADSLVKSASANMEVYVRGVLEGIGHVTAEYPQNLIGPGMTVAASAILGSVTMTPETHISVGDRPYRVNALGDVFESLLQWHSDNHSTLDEIRARYVETSIHPGDPFTLLNGDNEYYRNATPVSITAPKGYILENPLDFSLWKDVYNIQISEDGFVPIAQPSGRLLPHLLDPLSDMRAVEAIRVESEEQKRTDGRYTKVLYDDWREVFIKYM